MRLAHTIFSLILGILLILPSSLFAREEKVLRVCDDAKDPATLDPQKQFSEKNHTIVQQIYEGLVRFDTEGRIEPALATSWERIDPLRVRFHLRKGVSFHNGEPFTAEAVRYSIDRYLNPATGFPAFGFISSLEKAEVVDSHTVDLVTKFPDGLLLNRLAGFILIVPPKYSQQTPTSLHANPVGTGPFKFSRWDAGKSITLVKNENYWMAGHPKIDRLLFMFVPWDEQKERLVKKQIDIVTELPGTWTVWVMERGGNIVKKMSYYTMTTSLNINDGPLKDVRVRRALNHALNKNDLIRYDVLANAEPIATISMPGEEGHDPTLRPYEYSPAKARQLLKQAGYDGTVNYVVLNALVKDQAIRAAKIMKENFSFVGVTMNFHMTNDSKIFEDSQKKKWDLIISACPDPMVHTYFIQSITLYSKSPFSLAKYPKFDALLEDMVSTLDSKERETKAQAIDRMIYNEALGVFTYQRRKTYATAGTHIKFAPSVTGMPYFYKTDIVDADE